MMLSNRDRIGKGLELLNQGLYPYVEQQMQQAYPDDWETQAKNKLPDYKSTKKKDIKEWLSKDTGALLTVISKKWDDLFQKYLEKREKGIVEELIQTRNDWAHGNEFSAEDTYRAIDSMVRLLKAVKADEGIIQELENNWQFKIILREQNRQKNRQRRQKSELELSYLGY